jgi:hypothetical protein
MTEQTAITSLDNLVSAIQAVVNDMYAGHTATAAKRGKNPKFPYVPLLKITPKDGSRGRTTNPTQGVAYATREEAIAKAQQCLDSYRYVRAHTMLRPSHRAERDYHGLPRDITDILAAAGKMNGKNGDRVVMTFGKNRGKHGTITVTMNGGLSHSIKLDDGTFLGDVEIGDFDVQSGI